MNALFIFTVSQVSPVFSLIFHHLSISFYYFVLMTVRKNAFRVVTVLQPTLMELHA